MLSQEEILEKFLDLPPVKIPRPKVSYNCNFNNSYDSQDGCFQDIMDADLIWVNKGGQGKMG